MAVRLEPAGAAGLGLVGVDRRVVVGAAAGVDDVVRRAAEAGLGVDVSTTSKASGACTAIDGCSADHGCQAR